MIHNVSHISEFLTFSINSHKPNYRDKEEANVWYDLPTRLTMLVSPFSSLFPQRSAHKAALTAATALPPACAPVQRASPAQIAVRTWTSALTRTPAPASQTGCASIWLAGITATAKRDSGFSPTGLLCRVWMWMSARRALTLARGRERSASTRREGTNASV